ncbi:MAG: ATP-binding protein [Pirellulales bacterium]
MRLHRARLHPFGHFADETFDLAERLVVVHGPNERGKSTLRQAIFHALFTPTDLTPTRLTKSVRPWLPLPAGDHAAVTLTFEHDGKTWTLHKRWGAGQASELREGGNTTGGSDRVQASLAAMLVHGEATFQHVLFTGQAELERTLATIAQQASELRDVRDLLKAATSAAADVDEQRLRMVLEQRIREAFSRWDDAGGRPEPQNGQDKGVANRWKRDVGHVLEAWYAWQAHEAGRRDVLALEADIDRVTTEVAAIEQVIRDRDVFVTAHGGLRNGLTERATLEERVQRLAAEQAALQAAFAGWPTAQAAVDAWNRAAPVHEADLVKLQDERAAARARQAGAATVAAFGAIQQAKATWEKAEEAVAAHPHPGDAALTAIVRLDRAIGDATQKLAARTLSWHLDAEASRPATVVRGNQPPEPVAIGSEESRGTAQGRFQVTVDGITVTVTSGEDDVDALFASITADRASLARHLESCGATSPEDAAAMATSHRDHATAAANAKQVYAGLLQGKTFEQWREAVESLETLPATRDIETLEREINAKQKLLSEGAAEANVYVKAVSDWTTLHTDLLSLGRRLVDVQREFADASDKLTAAPRVPGGYESVEAFLAALDEAEQERIAARDRFTARSDELTRLTERLADRRSEDLAETCDTARRAFERVRAKGRDYLRIRTELDRITAGDGDDPLATFGAKVTDIFSRITGRPATLAFDGSLPATVERDGVLVPHEQLSHGAGGALALAVRLALAEAHLDGSEGFVMLDDPLVNLDKDRMQAACDVLRDFSARTQVLFFTCHDHHAARLQQPAATAQVPQNVR